MDDLQNTLHDILPTWNTSEYRTVSMALDSAEAEGLDRASLAKRIQKVCMDLMGSYAYHLLPFGDSLGKQYLIHRISEDPRSIGPDDVLPLIKRYKGTADVFYPEQLFHQLLLLYHQNHKIDADYLDCKDGTIQFLDVNDCWIGCYMKSHFPTHQFHITKSVDAALECYWNTKHVQFIPSDMLLSGCVPVLDSEIVVHVPGVTKTDREHLATVRICVFEDYRKEVERAEAWLLEHKHDKPEHQSIMTKDAHLMESDKKGLAIVGAMECRFSGKSSGIICEFGVMPGVDGILLSNFLYYYGKESDVTDGMDGLHEVRRVCCDFLKTWYNIQISMFHPFLRSMFEKIHASTFRWKRILGNKVSPQRIEPLNLCYLFEESLDACQRDISSDGMNGWGCLWKRTLDDGVVKLRLDEPSYPQGNVSGMHYHIQAVLSAYEKSCKSGTVCRSMGVQCDDCKVYKSVVK